MLAEMLNTLSEKDELWTSINPSYCYQLCFKTYDYQSILNDRNIAKAWFQEQCTKFPRKWLNTVIKKWISLNHDNYEKFISEYKNAYNKIAKKKHFETI